MLLKQMMIRMNDTSIEEVELIKDNTRIRTTTDVIRKSMTIYLDYLTKGGEELPTPLYERKENSIMFKLTKSEKEILNTIKEKTRHLTITNIINVSISYHLSTINKTPLK